MKIKIYFERENEKHEQHPEQIYYDNTIYNILPQSLSAGIRDKTTNFSVHLQLLAAERERSSKMYRIVEMQREIITF